MKNGAFSETLVSLSYLLCWNHRNVSTNTLLGIPFFTMHSILVRMFGLFSFCSNQLNNLDGDKKTGQFFEELPSIIARFCQFLSLHMPCIHQQNYQFSRLKCSQHFVPIHRIFIFPVFCTNKSYSKRLLTFKFYSSLSVH